MRNLDPAVMQTSYLLYSSRSVNLIVVGIPCASSADLLTLTIEQFAPFPPPIQFSINVAVEFDEADGVQVTLTVVAVTTVVIAVRKVAKYKLLAS